MVVINCMVIHAPRKLAAMVLVLMLLILMHGHLISAATGGRMGGSSFSSRSKSSPSSSRSLSSKPYGVAHVSSSKTSSVSSTPSWSCDVTVTAIMIIVLLVGACFLFSGSDTTAVSAIDTTTSVLMLQVALLGSKKSIQKDLNQISEAADTSTPDGLHYILTETALCSLRLTDYCISAYSSVDVTKSMEEGEKRFNQVSVKERAKFDEETLVNVNGIRKQSSSTTNTTEPSNEYLVITILVAAGGEHKLPSVNSSTDLEEALQKLASIPSSKTLAVEVLWTPQNKDDTLSERELLEDYPLLQPLE